MKLAIYTQIEENYGSHTWDGEGECPQRWKFKGGNTYVVENISLDDALHVEEEFGLTNAARMVNHIAAALREDNESFKEYMIDWMLVDDEVQICDKWETPVVLTVKSSGTILAECNTDREDFWAEGYVSKHETWEVADGRQVNYRCEWTTTDGRRGTFDELRNS